jgi:hypothetical protein
VNPPLGTTYAKASSQFLQIFRNANVIFVDGGQNDKKEFLSELQLNLRKNNVKYETISTSSTSGSLSTSIVSLLSKSRENVIIPASSDVNTLRVIIDELKKVHESDPTYVTNLFGHPEWQTYANMVEDYHLFGTYIYTPFFIEDKNTATQRFRESFRKWYDRNLMETHPGYGLWGYDTGLFFLTALRRDGTHFEQNIQRTRVNSLQFVFHFERLNNWGGFINNGLFLVHYDRNGQIIKTDISK